MRWESYLDLAKSLADRTTKEANLRSAVSRAYYAAYHVALSKTPYTKSETGDTHRLVAAWYSNKRDIKNRFIAAALDKMRNYRNDADYRANKQITRQTVRETIGVAEKVIALLS